MTPISDQNDDVHQLTADEAMTLLDAVTITMGVWGEPAGVIRTNLLAGIRKLAGVAGVRVGRLPIKELKEIFRQEIGEVVLLRKEVSE